MHIREAYYLNQIIMPNMLTSSLLFLVYELLFNLKNLGFLLILIFFIEIQNINPLDIVLL